MKHTFSRLFALLLAVLMLCSLAGCNNSPISTSDAFSRGKINGNDYTSDFIGLTFHAPSGWTYYTDDQIASLLSATSSYLEDPSAFEKAVDGELIDFFCSSSDGTSNVDLSFVKSSSFTNLDASLSISIKYLQQNYEQMGFASTATDPVERTLCGRTYKTVELSVGSIITQYYFMTVIDNYIVSIAGTFADGTTIEQFEAMFS